MFRPLPSVTAQSFGVWLGGGVVVSQWCVTHFFIILNCLCFYYTSRRLTRVDQSPRRTFWGFSSVLEPHRQKTVLTVQGVCSPPESEGDGSSSFWTMSACTGNGAVLAADSLCVLLPFAELGFESTLALLLGCDLGRGLRRVSIFIGSVRS